MNTNVILPIIRNIVPSTIARDIIGVQPMTRSTGDIFGASNWTGRVRMHKTHYNHFLRVYNRRTYHHPDYLTNLGYTKVRLSYSNTVAAAQWCRKTLKKGAYVCSSVDFWFAYERDAILFTLKWG